MKSLLGKLGVILSFIVLVVAVLSLISCGDYFKNQVTVYPVGKTDKGLQPLNRTKYKAFPGSQVVIYWMPGFDFPSAELVKCIVRDRLNWSGEYVDGSGKFMMVKGKFFQTFPIDKEVHYVSRWKWWMLQIEWMFK
jgi:hypothetical protein